MVIYIHTDVLNSRDGYDVNDVTNYFRSEVFTKKAVVNAFFFTSSPGYGLNSRWLYIFNLIWDIIMIIINNVYNAHSVTQESITK